ncbi:MAG: BTAD domain-containing putative transcriptional regulator [Caldilineaceae bacterium]
MLGKGLALLAYLIANTGPCPRSVLAGLLWTDLSESSAKMNLRSLLYMLRPWLGNYLIITHHTVAFNRQLPYWCDVEIFTHTLSTGADQDPLLLAEVLAFYQPDFLAALSVSNASAFETWLVAHRQRLHNLAVAGWQGLVDGHRQVQQYAEGLAANRRLLELEPWNEAAHRQQMHFLVAIGQSGAALAQYEQCCRILQEEVDAPPSPETTALYEEIKAALPADNGTLALVKTSQPPVPPTHSLCVDQGAMPIPTYFYGRRQDLAALQQWAVAERCRVISVVGMGGQGKTTLAARFVQNVTQATPPVFEGIIWRSLLQAPTLTEILHDWLYHLSGQQMITFPATVERQLALLAEYIQQRRFLFVLDNAESVVAAAASQSGEYAAYLQLWQLFCEREHQSCLLVTARELTPPLNKQPEQPGVFRRLWLDGLAVDDGEQLLKQYGLQGNRELLQALQQCYSGSPLALTLVAAAIDELFAGNVAAFLQTETLFFGEVEALFDQQFARLSPLEQELLTWLALEQEPVTSEQLWQNLTPPPPKRDYLTALHTLLHRSLIQLHGTCFGVQNVILEYARRRLIEELYQELTAGALSLPHLVTLTKLNRYALRKAQAKDHINAGQERLLLAPLLQRLLAYWGRAGFEKLVQRLLAALRSAQQTGAPLPSGYAAANLLHLLRQLDTEIHGYDFSHLTLRQAALRNARLHNVNLTGVTFQECTFTDTFSGVMALASHPTGEWLAVGTHDGDIRLWRLGANEFYAVLPGHPFMITALAVSPNGRWLASTGLDCQIYLWDMMTHTVRYTWPEAVCFVRSLAFSPNGEWLLVPGRDGVVKFYAVTSGALVHTLTSPSRQIWSIAFSANGHWLAGGSAEGPIYLWATHALFSTSGAAPLAPSQTLSAHTASVAALLFSRDGRSLYSGGWDQLIYSWDVTPLNGGQACPAQPLHTLRGHQHNVRTLALASAGACLASGSADGTVRLWDAESGALCDTLLGHEQWVWGVGFVPTARTGHAGDEAALLVSVSNDQRIFTWEVDWQRTPSGHTWRGRPRQVLQGYTDTQRGVAFMPAGNRLISAGFDKQVRVWDVQSGAVHGVLACHTSLILSLAVSPTGGAVAWGDYERQVWLWSAPSTAPATQASHNEYNQLPQRLTGNTLHAYSLAFSPDGRLLAGGNQDSKIYLWDADTGQLVQTLNSHIDAVWTVAFSPDGQWLASAGNDCIIRLWAVGDLAVGLSASACLVRSLTGHSGVVRQVAFSPDGEWLVSSGSDRTLRIWACNGETHRVLMGHTHQVEALAVSPCFVGGRLTLASCDLGQQVRIWDFATGETLHAWHEPSGEIYQVAYSPDGKTLAGANRDGYIRLWDVQTGAVVETLRITKPYAGTNITDVTGLTAVQRQVLRALGAVEVSQ